MSVYFNEIEQFPANWLKILMLEDHLPTGVVDTRDIKDVVPEDLTEHDQCHFFAGIGGWPVALAIAGWPESWPVWTGSCPCQPFSSAGKRRGMDDERHLWPYWRYLIDQRRPPVIFGEQVASKAGRAWFAGVRADLEAMGYAVGAADLCAAGEGSPHVRQRLFWVANADGRHSSPARLQRSGEHRFVPEDGGIDEGVGDTQHDGPSAIWKSKRATKERRLCKLEGPDISYERVEHPLRSRPQEQRGEHLQSLEGGGGQPRSSMQADLPRWNGANVVIRCSDGYRRISVEPRAFPMAHGVPARVGRLRGYGNAIVPQVAAAFIKAYMDTRTGVTS